MQTSSDYGVDRRSRISRKTDLEDILQESVRGDEHISQGEGIIRLDRRLPEMQTSSDRGVNHRFEISGKPGLKDMLRESI